MKDILTKQDWIRGFKAFIAAISVEAAATETVEKAGQYTMDFDKPTNELEKDDTIDEFAEKLNQLCKNLEKELTTKPQHRPRKPAIHWPAVGLKITPKVEAACGFKPMSFSIINGDMFFFFNNKDGDYKINNDGCVSKIQADEVAKKLNIHHDEVFELYQSDKFKNYFKLKNC